MARASVPSKTREALFAEYNHRCAIYGSDSPHIHHIDENHSNNDPQNLLPLCPNCHLRDQHNPTRKIEIPKLQLFREYKDPAILKPQFHPLFVRMSFLDSLQPGNDSVQDVEHHAIELIELVQAFEMGSFYGKRLTELIGPPARAFMKTLGSGPDLRYEQQRREADRRYREKLLGNRVAAQALLIEQLRYQPWANEN